MNNMINRIEGRTAIVSAMFLSTSVYLSKMNPMITLTIFFLSTVFTQGLSIKILRSLLFIGILILLSGLFFNPKYALKAFFAFIAIISSGSLIYSSSLNEIFGALIFFKIPERFVAIISIPLSLLPTALNDLRNIRFVESFSIDVDSGNSGNSSVSGSNSNTIIHPRNIIVKMIKIIINNKMNINININKIIKKTKRIKKVYSLLKALVSVTILRSISHSEALYSKNFNYKVIYDVRSVTITDLILLFSSSSLLFFSIILGCFQFHPL